MSVRLNGDGHQKPGIDWFPVFYIATFLIAVASLVIIIALTLGA